MNTSGSGNQPGSSRKKEVGPNRTGTNIGRSDASSVNKTDINMNEDGVSASLAEASEVQDIMDAWNKPALARKAFWQENAVIRYDEFEKLIRGKKLDSNLKKCTAFVRKMRLFMESQKSSIESDLNSLHLTKYISEIAMVVLELRLKLTDIPSVVSICSEIHKRYPTFSECLMENFQKCVTPKELVPSALGKLSSDLRLFAELLLGGILPLEKGCDFLIGCIQDLMSLDADGSHLILPFTNLLRDLSDELAGVIPRDIRTTMENYVLQSKLVRGNLLPAQVKTNIKGMLKNYFGIVKSSITKKNEIVLGSEKYNRKLRKTKGEIPQDRQNHHCELVENLEKYQNSASKLANLLDFSMPRLRRLPPDAEDEFERALLMAEDGEASGDVPGIALFEDEETRQFYQDLPDLKKHLMKLNGSSEAGSKDSAENEDSDTDSGSSLTDDDIIDSEEDFEDDCNLDMEKAELGEENEQLDAEEADEDDVLPSLRKEDEPDDISQEDSSGQYIRQSFVDYLKELRNCVNKTLIDTAAYEFVEHFKSKRCRKELVKNLSAVPRQRVDLISLYSRLAASLSKVYPDVGTEICNILRKDFRYLVLKRDQTRLESKLRVTRFIAELTNFSVFPKSEAFNCLKLLLRNFIHHQIEMTCCFIDTCGRFMYRSYDSHRRMKLYLEEMLRRKSVQYLEPRYVYMVDCTFYQICPPAGGSAPKRIKTPLEAFLEYVLCDDLHKETLPRADQILRMYDWNCGDKFNLAVRILSSPWKLSYVQLDTSAALLASMKKFRPSVVQAVIEDICEKIQMGCEYELEDINNIRMSACQYFAHLYNYRNVSTTAIFNVLYYLISYGVSYQNDEFSRMDPPDSLYRIRLICFMLRISGEYFSTTKSNRRLDFFLKYFQRYYLYKRNIPTWRLNKFPHYITEFFEETIKRLRDNWRFAKTVTEAEDDIVELDKKLREKVSSEKLKIAIHNETKCVRIPVEVAEGRIKPTYSKLLAAGRVKSQMQVGNLLTVGGVSKVNGNVSTQNQLPKLPAIVENDEDMAKVREHLEASIFEEAFETMISETDASNTMNQSKCAEIPAAKLPRTESGMDALNYGLPKVKVTVLTKANNKPKGKTLEVPCQEDFLMNVRRREQEEKQEKQEVKTRVLKLVERQQQEDQKEKEEELKQVIGRLLFLPKRK